MRLHLWDGHHSGPPVPFGQRRALAALLLPALLVAGCSHASVSKLNEEGNRAFGRAEYPQALESYRRAQVERPDLPALNYNAGNVLHQQGEFQRAIAESLRATSTGETDMRVRAFYSIGADYYREGKLREALSAYKSALKLDPSDVDTKYNVEVIQRRLDREAEERQQLDQQAKQDGQGDQRNVQSTPTPQAGGQEQRAQPTPQAGNPSQQPGQSGQQPGQSQPGQSQPGQPNQQPGQPGQSGQPGQLDPNGQPSQQSPGQAQNGQAAAGQPGATGTPAPSLREQRAQLDRDLKSAQEAYGKAPSIDEALRILDIVAEQQRIADAERGISNDPRTLDK